MEWEDYLIINNKIYQFIDVCNLEGTKAHYWDEEGNIIEIDGELWD